jgi:hypothetical protein
MKKYCPTCLIPLELVLPGDDVWETEHLACSKCDGTHNLDEPTWLVDKFLCPKCNKSHGGPNIEKLPILSEYCEECLKMFTIVL